jgi:hypothetical protein
MAATSTRTTTNTTTVQGTGSLEQDGEMAPLAFEWKSTSAEGATAVTLEVVHGTSGAVYRGTLGGGVTMDGAAFDALAHVELLFSYSHDLNHFTVMGDHAALSDGLTLNMLPAPSTPTPPTASDLLQQQMETAVAEGSVVQDSDGYLLVYDYCDGQIVTDLRADSVVGQYIMLHLSQLEAKRQYVSATGNTYQIFTQNQEVRHALQFGVFKHTTDSAWGTQLDFGTQADLTGCVLDTTHRHNCGGTDWDGSCSVGRATYYCAATDKSYIGSINTGGDRYGWPHPCRAGGVTDHLEGLINSGCAVSTCFSSAPDGQAAGRYSASMPCRQVRIWVKR